MIGTVWLGYTQFGSTCNVENPISHPIDITSGKLYNVLNNMIRSIINKQSTRCRNIMFSYHPPGWYNINIIRLIGCHEPYSSIALSVGFDCWFPQIHVSMYSGIALPSFKNMSILMIKARKHHQDVYRRRQAWIELLYEVVWLRYLKSAHGICIVETLIDN